MVIVVLCVLIAFIWHRFGQFLWRTSDESWMNGGLIDKDISEGPDQIDLTNVPYQRLMNAYYNQMFMDIGSEYIYYVYLQNVYRQDKTKDTFIESLKSFTIFDPLSFLKLSRVPYIVNGERYYLSNIMSFFKIVQFTTHVRASIPFQCLLEIASHLPIKDFDIKLLYYLQTIFINLCDIFFSRKPSAMKCVVAGHHNVMIDIDVDGVAETIKITYNPSVFANVSNISTILGEYIKNINKNIGNVNITTVLKPSYISTQSLSHRPSMALENNGYITPIWYVVKKCERLSLDSKGELIRFIRKCSDELIEAGILFTNWSVDKFMLDDDEIKLVNWESKLDTSQESLAKIRKSYGISDESINTPAKITSYLANKLIAKLTTES